MDMQQALRHRIRSSPAVAAIVGSKVDWGSRTGLPAVSLIIVSGDLAQHMKGAQTLQFARVQADCWAATYAEAKALADAVIAACLPRALVEGVLFRTASATLPRDLGEQTSTAYIHRKQTDLTIRYSLA
ncbi:tail completion protein gp17 [Sphingobium yanoikuyae]|uniref:DUF3168 domain-containing protein n=1 Tax=Sphingobium yanoikuyae TaxID=13690 RepID=A0A2D1R699_SPHYA|nr:DUF3168 domain-containing protein [Sphingobium yanoikuyae]ATP20396.1 DUF3168 domain-containing protein [Sphingobium yanoikuyae]